MYGTQEPECRQRLVPALPRPSASSVMYGQPQADRRRQVPCAGAASAHQGASRPATTTTGTSDVHSDSPVISRPARLSDLAADRLRERILGGHLEPGATLSQESLAKEFGISRTPLRDALKMLERDGLIQFDATGSAAVIDPSVDDAKDLLLIRQLIDSVAARRAASLRAAARMELDRALQPIFKEFEQSAAAEDRYRFRVADSQFHVAILQHCGLVNLDRCRAFVHTTAISTYNARTPSPGHLADASKEHREIGRAIAEGHPDLSAGLAENHVLSAFRYYYLDA